MKNIALPTIPPIDISPAIEAIRLASQIPWEVCLEQMTKTIQTIHETNYAIILQAMESAVPHLEENQRKACEEEIIPKLKNPHEKPLTRSELIAILGIFVSVILTLLSLRSDPQAQRIIEQNDIIIQQNERALELAEDRNELVEAAISEYSLAMAEVLERLDGLANNSDNGEPTVNPCNGEDDDLQQPEPSDYPKENGYSLNELSDTE